MIKVNLVYNSPSIANYISHKLDPTAENDMHPTMAYYDFVYFVSDDVYVRGNKNKMLMMNAMTTAIKCK